MYILCREIFNALLHETSIALLYIVIIKSNIEITFDV